MVWKDAQKMRKQRCVGRIARCCLLVARRQLLALRVRDVPKKVTLFDRRKGQAIRFRHADHARQVRFSVWGLVHARRGYGDWHSRATPVLLFHRRGARTACFEDAENEY